MPLHVPISLLQFWTFSGCGLVFFLFLLRALSQRKPESGSKRDPRSRAGIAIQSIGIAFTGFGPVRPTLAPLAPLSLAATATILVLMGGAIGLFAASSRELGRNWSLVARTRSDHELVRSGPYSRVRHPIYLAMLLFLLGLAVALGHYVQLAAAIPLFLVGTKIRRDAEDRLLRTQFGEAHGLYAREVPALIPKIV
ncbi:MAG: methyltransferase family protein [Sphingomicrobium sp.]